uniref:Uncharacterized protein n=1 Tax=Kalanchoe fedtschenkoi TaxID=63787 RepID=A0A7N1A164_KALFE
MASRQTLKRIGEEGFRMIDQANEEKQRCLYHPTKPTVHYLQPPSVTQVHRIPPPQIAYSQHQSLQPATAYHAIPQSLENISTHYNPPRGSAGHTRVVPAPVTARDQAQAGVMDCYEAARRYGGIVVTDYYPNKKVMMQRINKAF